MPVCQYIVLFPSGVVVAKLDPYSGREMRRLVDLVHLELVAFAEQDVLVKIFPYKRAGRQIFKAVKKESLIRYAMFITVTAIMSRHAITEALRFICFHSFRTGVFFAAR